MCIILNIEFLFKTSTCENANLSSHITSLPFPQAGRTHLRGDVDAATAALNLLSCFATLRCVLLFNCPPNPLPFLAIQQHNISSACK